ncbi:STAS domain-containing protein [Rhodovulum adriaticum]|uniref:Anti-sigma factor antagonist n=1 Tax=Rhodovulum adriaticum TaxID=35804 RepID=A0A4R2NZX7_RHOAD|nr:STAS domain-containing protein [Rhodovulum adriaticum]MBK1634273.1 anti-anti-sigma factor [Rhodovulum adriaticum]TCP27174.1 anti-sigma B factor antagonist [Rhodovulum adriaticum]
MELLSEIRADALHVTVGEARIDSAVAIRFKERMREVAIGGPSRVVLDLGQVTFLDSSGLGAVVAVMKLLAPGQRLELCCLTPTVAKVFRLTRMDRVFTIHDDAGAAFAVASDCRE